MKKRDLYLERIQINDEFSIQIDPDNMENLLIYQQDTVIETFSLKRRIYTFFKELQCIIQSNNTFDFKKECTLYAEEIKIRKQLYMRVTGDHVEPMVEFYHKGSNGKIRILYLTKLTYMTQKLFNQMLIAFEVENDPKYIEKFPHIMDILGMIHI